MRVTSNFILLFLSTASIILFSCKGNSHSSKLLKEAQVLIEHNPNQALLFLDSIDNPQKMNRDDYMQYIVAYVGAKQEAKIDISKDTLIFEAQGYFNNKGDFKNAALANYYAAWVYYTTNNLPQSLESFMHAVYDAQKSNSNLLVGNSLNNIGYIYYQQGLFDSAIINYQRALPCYDRWENAVPSKMKTLTNIGRAYEGRKELDSACVFFNKALDYAIETNNEQYQSFSLQNLGVANYGMKEYNKAIDYFRSALSMNATSDTEIRQIYLYLLNIYNKENDPNFAKEYAELVKACLPEVTYKYTIKEMYAALADYYQQSGDYKQALEYRDLEKTTKEEIEKEANAAALLAADKKFHLTQKDLEIEQSRANMYLLLVVSTVVVCIVLVFVFFVWRDHKKGKIEIRECAGRYDEIKVLLFAMGEKYPKIEAEIKSMLEDD